MLVQLEATPKLLGHAPNRLGVQYLESFLCNIHLIFKYSQTTHQTY